MTPNGTAGRRGFLAAAGLLPLAASVGSRPARAAAPLKIRVGWATMPGHLIPVLFQNPAQKGLKHYGQSYTVEPVLFRGSSPQITAMAAGELDLVAYAPSTLALTVDNAGIDTKVIADIIQDGKPGWHSETWLVRADSGIKTPKDLKGKRIATNAIGSASDTAMRAMLEKVGLKDRRDYVTIQAAFPNMPALLRENKVDCSVILLPELLTMEKSGQFRPLFQAKDALGETELVFLAGRAKFLDENRAAMMDFMEDYVRSRQWFMAEQNRRTAIQIIADFMKVPTSDLSYLFTHEDYYRAPDGRPDIQGLQRAIDVSAKLGVLKQAIEVAPRYVDSAFLDEANRRIKGA